MDMLSRCLIAQFLHGKLPGRSMSFEYFTRMMNEYQPADDAASQLRAASRAISRALGQARNDILAKLAAHVACGLLVASGDPLLAKALTAIDDYIGDDRKEAIARRVALVAMSRIEVVA